MGGYQDFLARKASGIQQAGRPITPDDMDARLHDWQKQIVAWACRTGRAPSGQTPDSAKPSRSSNGPARYDRALIVAPLAVCEQTSREAATIGLTATYTRDQPTGPGIFITNYEMVDRFDPSTFDAVVLDEASILKQSDGKPEPLIRAFGDVPHRLTATATPAPNDPEELTNQAEFLGVHP